MDRNGIEVHYVNFGNFEVLCHIVKSAKQKTTIKNAFQIIRMNRTFTTDDDECIFIDEEMYLSPFLGGSGQETIEIYTSNIISTSVIESDQMMELFNEEMYGEMVEPEDAAKSNVISFDFKEKRKLGHLASTAETLNAK